MTCDDPDRDSQTLELREEAFYKLIRQWCAIPYNVWDSGAAIYKDNEIECGGCTATNNETPIDDTCLNTNGQ